MERPTSPNYDPTYADLLAAYQPHSASTEAEAERLRALLDELTSREELTDAEWEFLALLGDLITAWDQTHESRVPVPVPERIRALLEAHNLPQKALAGTVFSTESVVSDVLHGRRRLNYDQVERLAGFFHVSPAVFHTDAS